MLAAPLAVFTLPILDTVAALLRRKLTGRSIYTTDRGHLHHRLLDRLGSNSRVLFLVGACCGATSLAALASVVLKNDLVALLVAAGVIGMFIATDLFGRAEFRLLVNRVRAFLGSFFRLGGKPTSSESIVHLQGSIEWQRIWSALTESADKLMLRRIRLDVNVPELHESFNADWEHPVNDDSQKCWQLEMPLLVEGQYVGQLTVVGQPRQGAAEQDMAPLLELVGICESYLQSVIQSKMEAQQAHSVSDDKPMRRAGGTREMTGVR